jgi:hypothetical protein
VQSQLESYSLSLTIPYKDRQLVITQESAFIPAYDPNSTDNLNSSGDECHIDAGPFSARHRVVISNGEDVVATRVFVAGGGASAVHAHSAFVRGDTCFLAIGPFVCALELSSLRLKWATRSDPATCFGIYDAPVFSSIISHGELDIARLTYTGELLWSAGGHDIFTGPFLLNAEYAEATDWDGVRYRFDLETGRLLLKSQEAT